MSRVVPPRKAAKATSSKRKIHTPPPAPVEITVIPSGLLPEIRRLQAEHRQRNPGAPPLRVRMISRGRAELY